MTWVETTKELVGGYVEEVRRTIHGLEGPNQEPKRAHPKELPPGATLTADEIVSRLRPLSIVLEITNDCETSTGICQTCPRFLEIIRAHQARCRVGEEWVPVGLDPSAVSHALDEVNAPITVLAGGEVTLRTDILALSLKDALDRGSVVFLLTNCVDIEAKFERHRALFGSYPALPHKNLVIQFSVEGFDEQSMARVRGEHARTRLERCVAFFKKLGFAETNLAANVTVNNTVARDLRKIVGYLETIGVQWVHVLPIYPTPHMDAGLALTEADRVALAEEALRLKRQGAGILNSEQFFQFVSGAVRSLCFPLGTAVFMPELGSPPYECRYAVGEEGREHLLRCLVPGRFKPGCYYADFDGMEPELPLSTYAELRQSVRSCPNLSRYVERTHERCHGCYVYCTFDIPGVSEWVLAREGTPEPSSSI